MPSPYRICLLPGDGIGPEVLSPAVRVLSVAAEAAGVKFELRSYPVGGAAIDATGVPLPQETLNACRESDVILLGAVGGPRWDASPPHLRPEKGLLGIRQELGLFGNLRPVRPYPALLECSPLKPEILRGVDLVVVRELTGGLYFGEPRGISGAGDSETGVNTMTYRRSEVERIARQAFALARRRRRRVTSVDKANVLEVSQLWRQVVTEVGREYPEVEVQHQYVDNCAMQLVLRPSQFDVLLTENTFGDILSDIGGVLTGSIGTLPSASIGRGSSLFEPVHGSAPDIAGTGAANPVGAIACIAMMFEIAFERPGIGAAIYGAVEETLVSGFLTRDLAAPGSPALGTQAFADQVLMRLPSQIEKASDA